MKKLSSTNFGCGKRAKIKNLCIIPGVGIVNKNTHKVRVYLSGERVLKDEFSSLPVFFITGQYSDSCYFKTNGGFDIALDKGVTRFF